MSQDKQDIVWVTVGNFPFGKFNDNGCLPANEIDFVIPFDLIYQNQWDDVCYKIEKITYENHLQLVGSNPKKVKWIIEPQLLSECQLETVIDIINKSDADYIKTNTGFFGTTPQELLQKVLDLSEKPVKWSGGIKTVAQIEEGLCRGVKRFGTSAGIEIMKEYLYGGE